MSSEEGVVKINDEKLIELVQAQPAIYDKTSVHYSNKNYGKTVWTQIAMEMDQSVGACQKRWRYLRDYFVRQLHVHGAHYGIESPLAIGPASRKKSLWVLFDKMFFLAPFSSTRKPHDGKGGSRERRRRKKQKNQDSEQKSVLSISSTSSREAYTLMDMDYAALLQDQLQGHFAEQFQQNHFQGQYHDQDEFQDHNGDFTEAGSENMDNMGNGYEDDDDDHDFKDIHLDASMQTDPPKKPSAGEMYEEILTLLRQSNEVRDEHDHFFRSLLNSVRQINSEHIISFRTEILQVIMKYLHMSHGDKLAAATNGSNSDVVVIDTGELHWRHNLSQFQ